MSEEIRFPCEGAQNLSSKGLVDFFEMKLHRSYKSAELDGPLVEALDLVVNDHDDRATLDSVEIIGVHLAQSTGHVEINYRVTFSAYHGCRDKNYSDFNDRIISGYAEDGYWVFEKFQAPERLAPNEEF